MWHLNVLELLLLTIIVTTDWNTVRINQSTLPLHRCNRLLNAGGWWQPRDDSIEESVFTTDLLVRTIVDFFAALHNYRLKLEARLTPPDVANDPTYVTPIGTVQLPP
jgi:hypothetical protein